MAVMIIRTLILYGVLFLAMRLLGKRQLGEMELSELALAAMIADIAAIPLQDIGIPLINGVVPVLTLFCCGVLVSFLSLKSNRLRTVLFGKPSFLIVRGKILQAEMRKNRFTVDELLQELRNQSIGDISKVEYAILETDGKLNIMLYPSEKPVTPALMKLEAEDGGFFSVVICDGRILDNNLQNLGLDEKWLAKQLRQRKVTDAKKVFFMAVNEKQQIYLAEKGEN